jgi:hypothetical protein
MNSDITKLYLEGVKDLPSKKEESKWKSMREQYLQEILIESSHIGADYKIVDSDGAQIASARLTPEQLSRAEKLFNSAANMSNKSLKSQIEDLINSTGFGSGDNAKGGRALLHTLHYIFGVEIEDHADSHEMLENMIDRGTKMDITPHIQSETMFEVTGLVHGNENFNKLQEYKEVIGSLFMSKPSKQPNVGDGEFMLCCFFNTTENSADSRADLITDNKYTVEVKGKDARMGSGSDNYAFNVWKNRKFQDLISSGGGDGVKRIATQQQYSKKVNIKSPSSWTSKIVTQIGKVFPAHDGLYSNDEETNNIVVNALAKIEELMMNIGASTFDDSFIASISEQKDTLSNIEWDTLGKNNNRKEEIVPGKVYAGAGTKKPVKTIIDQLDILIPLLGQIHSYEVAANLTHTASFYGQQIQAWVNWIVDEVKKISDANLTGQFTINELTNIFIDGMLEARNWSFDKDPTALSNLRKQLTPICTRLLIGCQTGNCELNNNASQDIPSGTIRALVAAIHVWCYHRTKKFHSILFMSENKFSPDSLATSIFPCIGLDFPEEGERPLNELYDFFMNNAFTIQLDIDEARKDGIKVNFDG